MNCLKNSRSQNSANFTRHVVATVDIFTRVNFINAESLSSRPSIFLEYKFVRNIPNYKIRICSYDSCMEIFPNYVPSRNEFLNIPQSLHSKNHILKSKINETNKICPENCVHIFSSFFFAWQILNYFSRLFLRKTDIFKKRNQ